jgi:poly(3-hydroxybutyrate) depolymerase
MGCNMPPPATEPIGTAFLHMIDITGMAQQYVAGYTHRKFCTTMPKGYDNTKPYPVVFYGPGCGATGCESSSFTGRTDIIYVQAIATAGMPLVPTGAAPGCFQAGRVSTVDSPEVPYFDQVMAQVEGAYCVDKGKIFAAGTSSGGWLSNYLGCARGGVIRGIAADSGGIPYARPMCTGGAAAMEFPGDSAVTSDPQGHPIGLTVARDLFIQTNGCSMTPTNMMFGNASCQFYGGCSSPVVWCNTGGAHQAGNSYLSPSGWAFWSTLQ